MEIYSGTLGHFEESNAFSVRVNGEDVFVEQYNDIHFAWFGHFFPYPADVSVAVNGAVNRYELSPKRFGIMSSLNRDRITFVLDKPCSLMLHELDSFDAKLILVADYPDLNRLTDVINIKEYGAIGLDQNDETAIIQQAIDELPEDGTLYFPQGCYRINNIKLKSNMRLYLAGGARIREWGGSRQPTYMELITLDDAENVIIDGKGIIDGNGSRGGWHWHCILGRRSKNVTVQDLMIVDPWNVAVRFVNSENIQIKGAKVFANNHKMTGGSIHCESLHDLVIRGCTLYSTDDRISIGSTRLFPAEDQFNVKIEDCVMLGKSFRRARGIVFYTNYAHIEIANVHDLKIENCDMVNVPIPLGLYAILGCNIEDVHIKDVFIENPSIALFAMEVHDSPDEWWGDYDDCCQPWDGVPGHIRNVYFKNIQSDGFGSVGSMIGYFEKGKKNNDAVSHVKFKNFKVDSELIINTKEANFNLGSDVTDMVFRK